MVEENTGDEKKTKLGEHVAELAAACRGEDVTLQQLVERMEGKSFSLLILIISLPFCQPVPLAGLSTPFGSLLAYFGFRMMLGRDLRLPERMKRVVIPKKFFPLLIKGAGRLLLWLEKHLRGNRGEWTENARVRNLCGANIVFCSILLALPLPIPFTNVFPAIPIALTAAALLERDGKMLVKAAIAAGVNVVFWLTWLVLILIYGWPIVEKIESTVRGWFGL